MADKELGKLVVRVDLDGSKFQSGITGLNRQLKLSESEFKAASQIMGVFGKSTDSLKLKSDFLSNQLSLQKQKVDVLKKSYDESVAAKGKDAKATELLGVRLNKAVSDLAKTENELNTVNKTLDKQGSTWNRMGQNLNKVSDKLKTAGEHMTNIGSTLATHVTLPIGLAAGAAIKASIDFESSFAGVTKTVNASTEEFAQLRTQILEMSKEMPASASEIAHVAESAGQLGIKTPAIIGFTKTMINLGVATNLSADEAATSLARLANITQLPQSQFEQLGSVIVALGNNMATTEADITEMGLRIAGAGHQVGLTQAQILSFAAALSSVGVNAESGGSSISRVMVDISSSVQAGGAKLSLFAKVAGQSVSEFKKSFKTDAAGAIVSFIEGLNKIKEHGGNVFGVLKKLGFSEIQVRDALLRASGAGDLFRRSLELGNKAWSENTALSKEAATRYKTTASQLKILQNRVTDVGIEVGDALAPALIDALKAADPLIKGVEHMATSFHHLDPATQKVILGVGAVVIAAGPLLTMLGAASTGVGVVTEAFGAASIAIAEAGGAAAIAAAGVAALTGPIGLTVVGLAALTAGGIMFADMLSEDAIPKADLFGDKVSDSTKKAVSAYLDLDQKATVAINSLAFSGSTVTQGMANKITGIVDRMTNTIVQSLQKQKDQNLQQMQDFFSQTDALSTAREQAILQKTADSYTKRILATQQGENQIKQILDKASQDHRNLTTQEENQIGAIQQRMKQQAIQTLSANEQEQKTILERMKASHGIISAQEAAQVVQESVKAKNGVIKEANEKYNQTIAWATKQRDQNKTISADEASKIIAKAKEMRDKSVKHAQDQNNKVVAEAKKQAKGHVDQVNWETGQMKSKWQTAADKVVSIARGIGTSISNINWSSIGASIVSGLSIGIDSGSARLASHAASLAGSIHSSMQARLDINSPSRVMMKVGESVGEGLSLGLTNSVPLVSRDAASLATAAIASPNQIGGTNARNAGGSPSAASHVSHFINNVTLYPQQAIFRPRDLERSLDRLMILNGGRRV